MRRLTLSATLVLTLLAVMASPARGQMTADSAAIVATALDYIDGYYTADSSRMERALHPDLAKRIVRTDPQRGRSHLGQMSALTLVQATRSKEATPENERQQDVAILDIFGNTASVKIVAQDWVDYLHVARWNGEWKVVNVLWELKPGE